MLTAQKYSLLIPTFNRPSILDALLAYLATKKVQFPIFILDSSANENKIKNRVVAKRHGLDVRHLEFNEDARFDFKIGTALLEMDSDYVSLCADDDIVFVKAIEECIDELDADATLAACHGIYLNFHVSETLVNLTIEYASPSIDMDDVVDRACQLLMRYEALNYAVYRRHVMVEVIDAVSKAPQTLFWELFSGLAPLVSGKVKRLSCLYHGRRSNGATDRTVFHPATWIADDPDGFVAAFSEHKERLFKYYETKGVTLGPDARKALTQAHVIYVCRELDNGEGIKQALAGTPSPLAKIDLVSNKMTIGRLPDPNASKIRKIALLTRAWLGRTIRKMIARHSVIEYRGPDAVLFKSPRDIRTIFSDEVMADLSHYCRASAGE